MLGRDVIQARRKAFVCDLNSHWRHPWQAYLSTVGVPTERKIKEGIQRVCLSSYSEEVRDVIRVVTDKNPTALGRCGEVGWWHRRDARKIVVNAKE
jgi:hypothetical protein